MADNNNLDLFPFYPYENTELLGVGYRIIEYTSGALAVERTDPPPCYFAPVVVDEDGTYHFDRDNVEWYDEKPANADEILNEYDNPQDLKWLFEEMRKQDKKKSK